MQGAFRAESRQLEGDTHVDRGSAAQWEQGHSGTFYVNRVGRRISTASNRDPERQPTWVSRVSGV